MATKTKKIKAPQAKKSVSKQKGTISNDEIARQAYMLWLEKGGNQLDNWLEAERRLR